MFLPKSLLKVFFQMYFPFQLLRVSISVLPRKQSHFVLQAFSQAVDTFHLTKFFLFLFLFTINFLKLWIISRKSFLVSPFCLIIAVLMFPIKSLSIFETEIFIISSSRESISGLFFLLRFFVEILEASLTYCNEVLLSC